jgi:hypothetical protein
MAFLTSAGIVTCPLVVTLASAIVPTSNELPYL